MRTATFYFKNLFILVLIHFSLSCSKDEEPAPQFQENAQLMVNDITATSARLSLQGSPDGAFNAHYLVRKKGEADFKKYEYGGILTIAVDPGVTYEVTLTVDGIDGYPLGIVEFTPPPFDHALNIESENLGDDILSAAGYRHVISVNTPNVPSATVLKLVNTDDSSKSILVDDLIIERSLLSFTIPEEALTDEPYQFYQKYYLQYDINNISGYLTEPQDVGGRKYIFHVYNTKPYIEDLLYNEKIMLNCGTMGYNLTFTGFYFGRMFDFHPYYFPNSTAVITRIDDNSQIILDEGIMDCISYNRHHSLVSDFGNDIPTIHQSRSLNLKYPEIDDHDVKFTTGDYKIKITFSNEEGDYYETNEFEFTLE